MKVFQDGKRLWPKAQEGVRGWSLKIYYEKHILSIHFCGQTMCTTPPSLWTALLILTLIKH